MTDNDTGILKNIARNAAPVHFAPGKSNEPVFELVEAVCVYGPDRIEIVLSCSCLHISRSCVANDT